MESMGNSQYSEIKDFKSDILNSENYQILSYNVVEAREHRSDKAKSVVYAYDHINLNPGNVRECFVLETTINYLALHSFPEYYLNPLAIDPNYQGAINTIGSLIIDYQGVDQSINSIIMDESNTPESKKESVDKYLNECLSDMNIIVRDSLSTLNKRAFQKLTTWKDILFIILNSILFILANTGLFLLLVYPFDSFLALYQKLDPSKIMTYIAFLFPVSTFLYDFFFVFYHSYKAHISESYNYARRFLRRSSSNIYHDMQKGKNDLFDYISGAINSHIPLKDDIKLFSKISSSYIDFSGIMKVDEKSRSKKYRFLKSVCSSLSLFELAFLVFSIIIYALALYFKTAI